MDSAGFMEDESNRSFELMIPVSKGGIMWKFNRACDADQNHALVLNDGKETLC